MESDFRFQHKKSSKPTITFSWEFITPSVAAEYLDSNTKNRPKSKAAIDKLTVEIVNETYLPTHQGIAFADDGELLDGQHRLLAVVAADKPVWLAVARNVPSVSRMAIDTGKLRTTYDSITLSGMSVPRRHVSVARYLFEGINHPEKSRQFATNNRVADALRNHGELIEACARNSLPVSLVAAAVKASHHKGVSSIERFLQIVSDAIQTTDEADSAAIALRRFLAHNGFNSGHGWRRDLYAKTEWCIDRFLLRLPTKSAIAVAKELYPLPGID